MNLEELKSQNPVDFTLAIPTYNRAKSLPNMLERLRSQINTENFRWEILIVDNNSTDDTAKVIQAYQADWPQAYPLKYIFEPQQGAAFARQRAIVEARSELIGFLDDDNLPAPDWVATAYSFGVEHPEVGVYDGQIHGLFETDPPENFRKIHGCFVSEQGSKPFEYKPKERLNLPRGASFVVRKKVWLAAVPDRPALKGRVGKSMVGGEDWEVMLYIYKAGWPLWYNPHMHCYHQIPSSRLEKQYLVGLIRDAALCNCELRLILAESLPQKVTIIVRMLLGNLSKIITHFIKYRGQLKTDLIAAGQMAFLWGSFLSPLYFLKSQFEKAITPHQQEAIG